MDKTVKSKLTGETIFLCGQRDVDEYESGKEYALFTMDGSLHFKEDETNCCSPFGKTCECGGFMHYQPVYGGYFYKCEKCLEED